MALAPHVWVFAWNEKLAPPTGPLEWTPRLGIATRAAVWAPHDVSFDTRCPGHGIPNTLNEPTVAMARKLPVAIVHVANPASLAEARNNQIERCVDWARRKNTPPPRVVHA